MARRNSHRVGDYLMTSDDSGRVFYASEMVQDSYGNWLHQSEIGLEAERQPQEHVKSRRDPYPVKVVRGERPAITTTTSVPFFIGETLLLTPDSPADWALGHDRSQHAGIGTAYITTAPTGDTRLIFEVA